MRKALFKAAVGHVLMGAAIYQQDALLAAVMAAATCGFIFCGVLEDVLKKQLDFLKTMKRDQL